MKYSTFLIGAATTVAAVGLGAFAMDLSAVQAGLAIILSAGASYYCADKFVINNNIKNAFKKAERKNTIDNFIEYSIGDVKDDLDPDRLKQLKKDLKVALKHTLNELDNEITPNEQKYNNFVPYLVRAIGLPLTSNTKTVIAKAVIGEVMPKYNSEILDVIRTSVAKQYAID